MAARLPNWLFPETDLIASFAPFNNLPTQYRISVDGEQKWFAQCGLESLAMTWMFPGKRVTVNAGGRLSLQLHHKRSEHWVVIAGTARVTRGEEIFDLNVGQSTAIPVETQHRLENPGQDTLHIIEVQNGPYLGEDDIVRFKDDYGRGVESQRSSKV